MANSWCWPRRCEHTARPVIVMIFPVWLVVCSLFNTGFLVMATHTNNNSIVYAMGSGSHVFSLTNATGTLFLVGVGLTLLQCAIIAITVGVLYVACCCGCRAWCCVSEVEVVVGGGGDDDDDTAIELDTQATSAIEHNQMDDLIFDTDTEPSDDR